MSESTEDDPDTQNKSEERRQPPPPRPQVVYGVLSEEDQKAFRDEVATATRSLRIRTIVAGLAFFVGFLLLTLSTPLAIVLPVALPWSVVEPIINRIGIFIAGLSVVGAVLGNYLQFGLFLPRVAQIPSLLRPGVAPIVVSRGTPPGAPNAGGSAGIAQPAEAARADKEVFGATSRLNGEIRELGRRGNINLVIGILTTVVGVSILTYVVYSTIGDAEEFGWKSAVHTILRVSIALFIQTFAYFFLRLYKTSLEDIKYYQNEITNVEGKLLAFQAARDMKSDTLMKAAVDALLKTERNFVLKKGDSTLGLERERLEKNEMLDLVKEAMGTVAKIRSGK